jgi:hypothetical protein
MGAPAWCPEPPHRACTFYSRAELCAIAGDAYLRPAPIHRRARMSYALAADPQVDLPFLARTATRSPGRHQGGALMARRWYWPDPSLAAVSLH